MRQNVYRAICCLLLLPLFLLFTPPISPAQAAEADPLDKYYPSDIEDHWAYDELDNFMNADLLKGYADSGGNITVKPNREISRAEFVAILVNAAGLASEQPGKNFTDVHTGKWYAEPVRIASSLGIVSGISDTEFGPDRPISRGEIAVMVVNAFSSSVDFSGQSLNFSDVPDYYAKLSIQKASAAGIVNGMASGQFKPFDRATRAQSVVMLQRALMLQQQNIPDAQALIDIAAAANNEQMQLLKDKKYSELEASYLKYCTGYQLAYNLSSLREFQEMIAGGAVAEYELVTAPTFTVIEQSDRFAVLESTGGEIKIKSSNGSSTYEDTVKTDGLYKMKKMPDNNWKIYAYLPYE
ncbi:S-layer homology domain-containing protein [Paenibacillus caui]|uniref:S-layer homology domain-containing protein n=1 Tax=Paenibacillus caui TaxID=2873927 RepID=UPI001CA871A3|nr:S-layer homology domain-containing protein [Paenibacillus caui]